MLCENCKKNMANTYFKQTVNGQTREIFLCSECASKLGLGQSGFGKMGFGLEDLMDEMFGFSPVSAKSLRSNLPGEALVCPFCSMTEQEFFSTGKAGCEKCYSTFRSRLQPLLSKLHGNKKHIGKSPLSSGKKEKKDDAASLKKELSEAIKVEDFEKAAILRDKIRDIEARNNG